MKIGILQTGIAPADLVARSGEYPDMFAALLAGRGFTFETWRVVDGEFPDGPEAADGWLITGSRHGVYEDHPWIAPLEALIRDIRQAGRPLVGVCFGHQIVAQALGGKVEKFAGGWSVGPQRYDFADGPLMVQAWHQDQVIEPPAEAEVVASNDFCRYAALQYPGAMYTVQPHPEFDDAFLRGLLSTRAPGLVPDAQIAEATKRLGTEVDSAAIADQFERFFKERRIA